MRRDARWPGLFVSVVLSFVGSFVVYFATSEGRPAPYLARFAYLQLLHVQIGFWPHQRKNYNHPTKT